MRSIFDQYDAPENRLTHALGCCLERDRRLLRAFIRWVTGMREMPSGNLEVLEQQVPGTPIVATDGPSGLPDLWIHDQDQWSLIVESKVKARISAKQLHAHRRTARRNGFSNISLLVLAPTVPSHRVQGVIYRTWPELYSWMRQQARKSDWAGSMAEYMAVAEARMTADGYLGDEPLTEFYGIPFGPDHPYTYREAKRVLHLALGELRHRSDLRKLGMDRDGAGRPAITGKNATFVWDFLRLLAADDKQNFTSCPHLTLSMQAERCIVIVTLPNAVPPKMRRNLTSPGAEGFADLVGQVASGVTRAIRRVKRAYPFMEVVQRHYRSQRSTPIVDARLEFDLRTAIGNHKASVKKQPEWLEATFQALIGKRSNLQVGIGAVLPYGDLRLHSRGVLDVVAGVWIGCKPWIDTVLGKA